MLRSPVFVLDYRMKNSCHTIMKFCDGFAFGVWNNAVRGLVVDEREMQLLEDLIRCRFGVIEASHTKPFS